MGGIFQMTETSVKAFQVERERLNEIVMKYADLSIKRFWNLDSQVYRDGALTAKTKELLGLVASLVLRCDDCIAYHIIRCNDEEVNDAEMVEALSIGLVVGGSITIPHLRRALRTWDELKATEDTDGD
jgi:AhpD family alkylhydroperoxidase